MEQWLREFGIRKPIFDHECGERKLKCYLRQIDDGVVAPYNKRKVIPLLRREVEEHGMPLMEAIEMAKDVGLSTLRLRQGWRRRLFEEAQRVVPMLPMPEFHYEFDFQGWIIDEALLHEWLVEHVEGGTRVGLGYPDLRLVHNELGRSLTVELKTDTGKLSEEQVEWLESLVACGETVAVWRPALLYEIRRYLWGISDCLPCSGFGD